MTSSQDSLATLVSAELHLFRIGGPILTFIGTLGSLLNLVVFTQKNLRKNPCSIYFIAFNLGNLLSIYFAFLILTLSRGYHINYNTINLAICRLHSYAAILLNCLSPSYLILAAIDRILITSSNALTRQKSTCRLAYISIVGVTLFWVLFHIHALILTRIIPITPNISICYFEEGAYLTFISYFAIMKEMVALSLMIICSLWSIKNIRKPHPAAAGNNLAMNRTGGPTNNLQSNASKDRQMIRMLFIDISMNVLFSFLYAIYFVYGQITENHTKSYAQLQIENIVLFLSLYLVNIPFCTSCYTNLIVSKTYRKEVKKLLSCR